MPGRAIVPAMSSAARRGLIIFVAGLALILAFVGSAYLWFGATDHDFSGIAAIGGPFALLDQNGVLRHDSDFRGELMLVYFGYTYCPDACPTALQTMTQALDDMGGDAKAVQPIFVTVDPERDTVAQMKQYAQNFHPRLLALTGSPEQVAAAANAYRIFYQKVKPPGGGEDYLVDHSSFIYLMGRDGRYLTHFEPDVTAAAMAAAIKKYL
jgi:cytochrome oxidase Cu insertion factor (SCO1/SenC/PrrC family)